MAQSPPGLGLHPVVLSTGWAIRSVQTNNLGSVAFIGGGYFYGDDYSSVGIADSVVLVNANGFRKLAKIGDPVPGSSERVFAGFESQALNDRDEVAFGALSLPAGNSTNCFQIPWPSGCVEGLYLYSGGHIQEIALSGSLAPETGERTFLGFGSLQLNNTGMIAFWAYVGVDEVGSVIDGYYLFDGKNTEKIVVRGEKSQLLGIIGFLDSSFLLSDSGTFTFCANGIVAQFTGGMLSKILASGDPMAGGGVVPRFDAVVGISGNRKGEVAFQIRGMELGESGLYLYRQDGQVVRILSHGDPSPVGGSFSMTYGYRAASLPQTGLRILNPQLNESGDVLFAAAVSGGTAVAGIFVYSSGQIRAVVVDGESAPFDPALMFEFISTDGVYYSTLLNNISFGPLGQIQFTAWISNHPNDPSKMGIFQLTETGISQVAAVFDPAPGTDGHFASFPFVAADALGDVVFYSDVCCGNNPRGVFRASLPSPEVPNAGFEVRAPGNLAEHWTTIWTNFGHGEAHEFDSNGKYSFEGKINLRLHVAAPSGGAAFVLSDPIDISPSTNYFLQVQMRYNLAGPADSVYFTVIQFDGSGNMVGMDERRGVAGDNFWTWRPKCLLFHTAPQAVAIRIRFGLIAASESYLDVDDVRGRDSP